MVMTCESLPALIAVAGPVLYKQYPKENRADIRKVHRVGIKGIINPVGNLRPTSAGRGRESYLLDSRSDERWRSAPAYRATPKIAISKSKGAMVVNCGQISGSRT